MTSIGSRINVKLGYQKDIQVSEVNHPIRVNPRGMRRSKIPFSSEWIRHRDYSSDLYLVYANRDRSFLEKTPLLYDYERCEFLRFFDNLLLWEEYCPKVSPPFSGSYYWINCIQRGPEFADYLKDYFAFSYRSSFGDKFQSPSEFSIIGSYNDIFPYQGLIKFKEDIDDYKQSLIPSTGIDESDLQELKDVFIELFREVPTLEWVNSLEILSEPSTSSCWKDGKFQPSCLVEENYFSSKLEGKRCVVPVYPAGSRDTTILKKSSANTVKLLERQMRHILEYIPESAVTLNSYTFRDRLSKNMRRIGPQYAHVLRDIKKCGLTFPLERFIDIFIEAGKEVFPSDNWHWFEAYKHRTLTLEDGQVITPLRGYFLGMGNHICTFILIALNRLTNRRFFADLDLPGIKVRSIIGNDDSDVCIIGNNYYTDREILDIAHNWLYYHSITLLGFDIFYNSKKSFVSRYPLFYEEYGVEGFKFKESRYTMILANCISLPSVRMAKDAFNSFMQSNEDINVTALNPMVQYCSLFFDIEFDEEEGQRDYYLGGWIAKKHCFLSTCLEDVINSEQDLRHLARIFDYIQEINSYLECNPCEVDEYSNASPCGKAIGVYGKAVGISSFFTQSKESLNRYYSRIIYYERKPSAYVSLVNQKWNHFKRLNYDDIKSYEDLAAKICAKIDCCIPDYFVKRLSDRGTLVHSFYFGYNEMDVTNKNIKYLLTQQSAEVRFDKEYDYLDVWRYLDNSNIRDYPEEILDLGYGLVQLGEVQNICSDGISSLIEYFDRTGDVLGEVTFQVNRKKQIPPWRKDPDFLLHPIYPEEFEQDIRNINLSDFHFFENQVTEKVAQEEIEIEDDIKIEDTNENFFDLNSIEDEYKGITFDDVYADIAKNDQQIQEEDVDSVHEIEGEKYLDLNNLNTEITTDDNIVEALFSGKEIDVSEHIKNLCADHQDLTRRGYAEIPDPKCLICSILDSDYSSSVYDHQVKYGSRSLDEVLDYIGVEPEETSDEGGFFGFGGDDDDY